MSQILEIVIFLPVIAALAIGFGAPARVTSLVAAWVNLALVLVLLSSYAPGADGDGLAFIQRDVDAEQCLEVAVECRQPSGLEQRHLDLDP